MVIDIDGFAQSYLGLTQDFQYLSHNGIYLGMMIFNDTNKVPVYDPATKEPSISARKPVLSSLTTDCWMTARNADTVLQWVMKRRMISFTPDITNTTRVKRHYLAPRVHPWCSAVSIRQS